MIKNIIVVPDPVAMLDMLSGDVVEALEHTLKERSLACAVELVEEMDLSTQLGELEAGTFAVVCPREWVLQTAREHGVGFTVFLAKDRSEAGFNPTDGNRLTLVKDKPAILAVAIADWLERSN